MAPRRFRRGVNLALLATWLEHRKGTEVSDIWVGGTRDHFHQWLLPLDTETFMYQLDGMDFTERLGLNLTASTDFVLSRGDVLLPAAAVQPEDVRDFVFVYNEGMLGKRYVQTGARHGGMVQIIAGIEPGEMVVIFR